MLGKGFDHGNDHGNVSFLILAKGDMYRMIEWRESVFMERGREEEESGLLFGTPGVTLRPL